MSLIPTIRTHEQLQAVCDACVAAGIPGDTWFLQGLHHHLHKMSLHQRGSDGLCLVLAVDYAIQGAMHNIDDRARFGSGYENDLNQWLGRAVREAYEYKAIAAKILNVEITPKEFS